MAVLQLFVTPEELDPLTRDFAAAHGLQACRYEEGVFVPVAPPDLSILNQGGVASRLFLFPSESRGEAGQDETPRPRERGWVDVAPGQLVGSDSGRILTLSTLQAEDRADLPFKPAAWIRKLRRKLSNSFVFGVRGTNVVFGGSHDYRDIGYSPKALELYQEGVLWKQFPSDNSEFAPLGIAEK